MRRRAGFLFIFGAAAPLVILVSAAWACGVLATLKATPSTATPGQTVRVTGVNYSPDMAVFTPVSIRLSSRTGTVLKVETPDPTGKIDTTVQLPSTTAGGHRLVLATQNKLADGTPKTGTPGRTVVKVKRRAAASSSAPAASPWSSSDPGAPGGSAASVDARGSDYSPLLAIILSGALLSIGVALVGRDSARKGGRRPLLGA